MTLGETHVILSLSKGGTAHPPTPYRREVRLLTVSEVIALLTLLAVVIFGVIDIMKKWPPPAKDAANLHVASVVEP